MNALIENLKSTLLLLLARLGCDLRGVFCLGQNACAVLRDCPSQRADDSVTVPPGTDALRRHRQAVPRAATTVLDCPCSRDAARSGRLTVSCCASTAARRTPGPLLPTPLRARANGGIQAPAHKTGPTGCPFTLQRLT